MKPKIILWIKENGFTGVFYLIVFVLVIVLKRLLIPEAEIIDFTVFSSVVAVMIINFLGEATTRAFIGHHEDAMKLQQSSDAIVNLYRADHLLTFENKNNKKDFALLKSKYKAEPVVTFAAIQDYRVCKNTQLQISDNSAKKYVLPQNIEAQYDYLMSAHSHSIIYNQLNVRVDDWCVQGNTFLLETSRTTYFDSLVSNRAMDYIWSNQLSIRQLYACGPFAPQLSENVLSNHLGFNGFVESSDGYIPFVKRSTNVSIGKNTYGASVSASLKTKYALCNSENRAFTIEGLQEAIVHELNDELSIAPDAFGVIDIHKAIIAAYRELVEGGKPQLLFYLTCNQTKKQIDEAFHAKQKKSFKEKEKTLHVLMDGKSLVWLHRSQLATLAICQNGVVIEGKIHKMVPSTSASLVMLIDYLKNDKVQ